MIFSLMLINILGCDNSKPQILEIPELQNQEVLEAQRDEIVELKKTHRKKILKLQNEIEQLHMKINERTDTNELEKRNKELIAQNEELVDELRKFQNQKKEMIKRIEVLIDGYQTGLWSADGADIYPIFKQPLKSSDVQTVISELNNEFMKTDLPKILFQKKENNIVFIGIDDAEQLTERMGSNGALSYMAEVTYSITSVKDVECVLFEFEEGDHAVPGQYCRYSFEPQTLL